MTDKIVATTCKECSVRCGALVHVRDGKVVKITGNPGHPHSRGAFCIKGVHGPVAAREHPDRPLHPMRRTGERGAGRWEHISWDAALGEIADRMGAVIQEHGALSVAGAVSNQFGSRGVAMSQLLRGIGSPNCMINQDMCQGCRMTAAMLTGVGAQAGNELEHSRSILVVGKSPSDSSVVQWMQIKAAKKAGASLIVIDPRRTQVARRADLWLRLTPGTDAALALSMIDVMFTEELYDRKFVAQWCTGTDALRARAHQYEPRIASGITGVPAARIVEAARLFARAQPGSMILGHGIDAQANGVQTAIAFHALYALTGSIDRVGGNRMPKQIAGFRDYSGIFNDAKLRMPRAIEERIVGGAKFPLWSGPDAWGKVAHNPTLINAILTGDPYPVRALYASGVNIVCTYPGMQNTIAALKSLDLLVVATDHLTPTAELADFILPKTNQLEEEDIGNDAGGACLSVVQRVLAPLGEARTDVEIAVALRDQLRTRGLIQFDVMPWNSHRGLIDFQLAGTGLDFAALCGKGFHEYPFVYEEYRSKGFRTPSGKIELSSDRLKNAGHDPVADYHAPTYAQPEAGFSLILITGIRSMAFHHSRYRNHAWARRIQSAPELRIHPATAARSGIGNDDWVWVETPRGAGRALLQARVTAEVPENVVATGMGWWYPERAGADRGALTFNIDAAVAYGPPWDPISGSPEARNNACRIVRAEAADLERNVTGALEG